MYKERIASIDILRGIAIAGMILCANIGFNSGLPAWMFHAQTPPPTYAFDPTCAGLTWVDLVFPFFLFPMGAAFPFAMRKRIESGQSLWKIILGLVKRWLILTCFALLLGNAYSVSATAQPAWQVYVYMIALWAGMFMSLVRIKGKTGNILNISGILTICLLGVIHVKWFGIPLDKGKCDIIIMILANVSLWGGLIWLLTRDNTRLRWLVFLLAAALKAMDSYIPETLSIIPSTDSISWFFTWDWLQYLLIVIPSSVVGDRILAYSRSGEPAAIDNKGVAAGAIALTAMLIQLWGLYTRNVTADFIISAALAAIFIILTFKSRNIYTLTAYTGFALMLAGIVFDPIDGGITKDYCNISYLLTTGGMAALVTSFLLMLEIRFNVRQRFLAGVGQNPMIAYTITSFLIGPILNLIGAYGLLSSLSEGSQFWGVVQGVIITGLMMIFTYMFTKLKLFWRS